MTEEKKLKSLIRFHSPKKINNYNRGGGERGAEGEIKKKKRKNPKESTEQVITGIINVFS